LLAEAQRVVIADRLLFTVNLTDGMGAFSRFVSQLWASTCDRWARFVMGCCPIRLAEHLEPESWRIGHHHLLVSFGTCSEVLVAERLELM
jgi:hypothetical protein